MAAPAPRPEAPIFEALASETVGTTMGLPVYRFPEVRALRARIRFQERMTSKTQRPARQTLGEYVRGERMYSMTEHHPDL